MAVLCKDENLELDRCIITMDKMIHGIGNVEMHILANLLLQSHCGIHSKMAIAADIVLVILS